MNPLSQINLGELKTFLLSFKEDTVLCPGLSTPHVYRGGASVVAFVPELSVVVRDLLQDVNRTLTERTLNPYGGRSVMYQTDTPVFLAQQEHYGQPLTLGMLVGAVDPWINIGEGFNRTH